MFRCTSIRWAISCTSYWYTWWKSHNVPSTGTVVDSHSNFDGLVLLTLWDTAECLLASVEQKPKHYLRETIAILAFCIIKTMARYFSIPVYYAVDKYIHNLKDSSHFFLTSCWYTDWRRPCFGCRFFMRLKFRIEMCYSVRPGAPYRCKNVAHPLNLEMVVLYSPPRQVANSRCHA